MRDELDLLLRQLCVAARGGSGENRRSPSLTLSYRHHSPSTTPHLPYIISDHGLLDPTHPKKPDPTVPYDGLGAFRNFHLSSKNNPTQPDSTRKL
jgi:hypothetical protein